MAKLLFSEFDLHSALEKQQADMTSAIDETPADDIRSTTLDELVAGFVAEFSLLAPELTEGAVSVGLEEVPVDVSGDWSRAVFDRNRPHYIQGVAATYFVPFTGEGDLFRCQPSTFTTTYPSAELGNQELVFRFERADADVAATKAAFEHELAEVRKYLAWVTADVLRANSELPRVARQRLAARVARLEQMQQGLQSLGLPVRQPASTSTEATRGPAPALARADRPRRQPDQRRYDVALSFAGEDRAYVEEVARLLQASGISVFYDRFEQANLWGKNLIDHLANIYQNRSRYVVMFISNHYVSKPWPTHERTQAQARALLAKEEYILPARFDDTDVPGLAGTVAYVDLRRKAPADFAALIQEKLGKARTDA